VSFDRGEFLNTDQARITWAKYDRVDKIRGILSLRGLFAETKESRN